MINMTKPQLTREQAKLRLECILSKISGAKVSVDTVEDGFDMLQLIVVSTIHDLESTKREFKVLRKSLE